MSAPSEIFSPYLCRHYSRRTVPITAIVIHDTAGKTAESALRWFADPQSGVSAHVVIDRDGTIWRVVFNDQKAWHAGVSSLHGVANVNNFSLGIELVDENDDGKKDPYPPAQIEACAALCAHWCSTYEIPLNRIVAHADVALPHGRKVDPGADFPWNEFLLEVAAHVGQQIEG